MLTGKVIVITGAAGLIGKSLVDIFINQGATVIATDANQDALDNLNYVFANYRDAGSFFCHQLDVTDQETILKTIEFASNITGSIDAVVNSAYPRNASYGENLEKVSYDIFAENISLHIGGYFLVTQQFCLYFKAQGKGVVLNMASIYGTMAPRFEVYVDTNMTMPVEYAAIKSAIISLTKYFAQYYKKSGIRVNALSPGGILDGQSKAFLDSYNSHCASKGMLDPEDVAKTAAFLISDQAAYVNGQNLIIDDGFSL